MNIVVLAGGLSTERDMSFKTGDMVSKALRENGHNVILLDVFMGYSDKEENLTGIFDRTEEVRYFFYHSCKIPSFLHTSTHSCSSSFSSTKSIASRYPFNPCP